MEPWVGDSSRNWGAHTWGEWARPDPSKFLEVFSHDRHLNAVQLQCDVPPLFPDVRNDRVMTIVSAQN